MNLYIVRHGQTNYNVAGLHNADPKVDVHLTDTGISEAKTIAERLKDIPFNAIYVSELPRTRQTADIINEFHQIPIHIDARLNDINSGFEGLPVSDYHLLRDNSPDPFTYRYPGAESSEDVYHRTEEFLKDLKPQDYHDVLIVTSKHNFRHFHSIINHLNPRTSLKNPSKNAEILIRKI